MTLPEAARDVIRWAWLGPLLITVVIMMDGAWAVNVDRKVGRLEEAVTELIRIRGEMGGKLETIINQNSSQDLRMTQISNRLDALLNIHINPKAK